MTYKQFPIDSVTGASITGKYFNRVAQTQSGRSYAHHTSGGYWEISIDLLRKSRVEHDKINAFLNARRGQYELFEIELPYYCNSKSSYNSLIQVKDPNQTGSSVTLQNITPNTTALKAGDFIKFENHSKVYMIEEDVVSDSLGNATMLIAPNLVISPSANESVVYNNVKFRVRNATDDITLNLDIHIRASWSLKLREAW